MIFLKSRLSLIEEASNRCSLAELSLRKHLICLPPLLREYRSRFSSEETVSFCLRVMVGVIILYDYVHPVGAFAKSSKIDVSTSR